MEDLYNRPLSTEPKQRSLKRYRKLILPAVVVVAIAAAAYFYFQYQSLSQSGRDVKRYTSSISRVYDLPNEEPSIATVSDKTKLNGQPFFANAENGDVVLIYASAGKAILFRPSSGKIVNIAPTQQAGTTSSGVTPAKK